MKHFLAVLFALFLSHHVAAQTPVTVYLQWDPPAAGEPTQSYNMVLDAAPIVSVPVTVTPACACIRVPVSVSPGPHTAKVTRLFPVLVGDPTLIESQAAVVTFTINPGDRIKNVKVVSK